MSIEEPIIIDGEISEEEKEKQEQRKAEKAKKLDELLHKHFIYLNYRKQITELLGTTIVK